METGLKGRSVIVAGSSQGMGRATAAAFAAEGARVAMCARNEKNLKTAAEDLRSRYHAEIFEQAVDVRDGDAVRKFVAAVAERFGGIEICVANAGGPPAKDFLSVSLEEWRQAVELSFLSVVHFAREVIPHMQRKRWGRLIAITSTSVRQPIAELVLSNAVRPAVVGPARGSDRPRRVPSKGSSPRDAGRPRCSPGRRCCAARRSRSSRPPSPPSSSSPACPRWSIS